jgi:hypothetical protein
LTLGYDGFVACRVEKSQKAGVDPFPAVHFIRASMYPYWNDLGLACPHGSDEIDVF